MTLEDENETSARYNELFKKLDKGGDGRIDIKDLTAALKELGMCESYAAVSFTTETKFSFKRFMLDLETSSEVSYSLFNCCDMPF